MNGVREKLLCVHEAPCVSRFSHCALGAINCGTIALGETGSGYAHCEKRDEQLAPFHCAPPATCLGISESRDRVVNDQVKAYNKGFGCDRGGWHSLSGGAVLGGRGFGSRGPNFFLG